MHSDHLNVKRGHNLVWGCHRRMSEKPEWLHTDTPVDPDRVSILLTLAD